MTENLLLFIGAIAYAFIIVTCIKCKVNGIEEASDIKPQKQAELATPCYDCQ